MTQNKQKEQAGTLEDVTRRVTIEGISDVMFDRYPGDNKTTLEVSQKMYLSREDGQTIILPALNLMSFFAAENTVSAPKRLMDSRKYKELTRACLSFLNIGPQEIPFCRDGKPITFGGFKGDFDLQSGVYIHNAVARLKDGVPNPKERPVLPIPWSLTFELTILANDEMQEQQVVNLMAKGGRAIGIGTFRGVFGKFRIAKWE